MIGSLNDMDNEIPDLLDWLRSNISLDKAMSRSEAGKYAAEQRWKNHAKRVDPVRVLEPKYQEIADRINAGTKAVTDAGMTIEIISSTKDRERMQELYKKFQEFTADRQTTVYENQKDGEEGTKLLNRTLAGLSLMYSALRIGKPKDYVTGATTFVIHDGSLMAGAALADIEIDKNGEKRISIWVMGSSHIVEGAGSAMYGAILKWGALQGVTSVSLQPADDARTFWQTKMGMMPEGLHDAIYSDSQIGMIGELK